MDKDIMLLVIGSVIALGSSFLTIIFNSQIAQRQWIAQKKYEAQIVERNNLAGSMNDLKTFLDSDISKALRSGETKPNSCLLPAVLADLEIETAIIIKELQGAGPTISVKRLSQLAIEALELSAE